MEYQRDSRDTFKKVLEKKDAKNVCKTVFVFEESMTQQPLPCLVNGNGNVSSSPSVFRWKDPESYRK